MLTTEAHRVFSSRVKYPLIAAIVLALGAWLFLRPSSPPRPAEEQMAPASAPTTEHIQSKREATPPLPKLPEVDRETDNVLYGKVLSGTASDAEIERYFSERRRVFEASIAAAESMLSRPDLPEQQRGLFSLARHMHMQRLDEIPREQEAARARNALQDERRAAWKR